MSHWQPIETAPRDGTRILLFQRDWNKVHFGFRGSDGWFFYDECLWSEAMQEDICRFNAWSDDDHGPTHWMPLPEPPTK